MQKIKFKERFATFWTKVRPSKICFFIMSRTACILMWTYFLFLKFVMLLGSRWSSCELGDVEACHILKPGALWVSLNTAWPKAQLESVCESCHSKSPANRHKPQDVKDGAVYWNHKAGGLCYQNHERIMEISSYNLHCGLTFFSCWVKV